ncbi:O-antigen ligase family protein [uncultured Bacteroides sp.]|uniref:O-antigen ligase family protein n=1 Tax=uncultured Bacteroides sp. TaxID=162156 RepID=UPI002AA69D53|nr:O-antigen ligase family protein [uncultured Bacteroides sp.]
MISKRLVIFIYMIAVIGIIAVQLTPWGLQLNIYNALRQVLIVMSYAIAFFYAIPFFTNIIRYKQLKIHLVCLFFALIPVFLFQSMDFKVDISHLQELFLPLLILMVSTSNLLSKNSFVFLCAWFIFLMTISACTIVYTYAPTLQINEFYFPIPKNQISPIYAVASLLALYLAFKVKGKKKIFYAVCCLILILSIFIIRGRSNILALSVVVIIFNLYYLKKKKYLLILLGITVLIIIPLFWKQIYDSLFLNYDISDMNSISTGRTDVYKSGIKFFLDHPFDGRLFQRIPNPYAMIHNYFLVNLVEYGLIISIPVFFLYFSYIRYSILNIRFNTFSIYDAGPFIMTELYIVSLFEYSYPYSPGSATIFPFFLLGQCIIRNNHRYR